MVKVTVEEQVVSDFKEYVRLTDAVVKEIQKNKAISFKMGDYLLLLELIMEHIHWVIEYYPVASEKATAETKAV